MIPCKLMLVKLFCNEPLMAHILQIKKGNNQKIVPFVEPTGFEPVSKQIRRKLSTCLFMY